MTAHQATGRRREWSHLRRPVGRQFVPALRGAWAEPMFGRHPASSPSMSERMPSPASSLPAIGGEPEGVDRLFPIVYEELRRLAHRHLQGEATGHTLTTTDLVHQAYLQLADQSRVKWNGQAHFMAVAATAMRRILVDHARTRRALKRGGTLRRVPLDNVNLATDERAELLVAVDEALVRLRSLDARQAQVVECRFFGGMTEEQTAEALGVAERTVRRDWAKAKSWLYAELYPAPPD